MSRNKRTLLPLMAGALIASFLGSSQAHAGYRQSEVRVFHARPEQNTKWLVGFDVHKQKTMDSCVVPKGALKIQAMAGKPAESSFEYVETLQEAFDREQLDVEVAATVNYVVKASVDVKLEEMAEAARKSQYGFVHGEYSNLHAVKWVTNDAFELTPEARALHDKAVVTGNWKPFYARCGQGALINKWEEDFFSVVVSFQVSDSMTKSQKRTAVKAMAGFADIFKASVSVDKVQEQAAKVSKKDARVSARWSGEPKLENVTTIGEAFKAFKGFTKLKNITDFTRFGVVPYAELIPDFGDLAGQESVGAKRRNKVRTILDGLDLQQRAIMKLQLADHAHAKQALVYLKADYARARKAFVAEKACLDGAWSLPCEDLRAKFAPWGKPTKAAVGKFVDNMLSQGQTCPQKNYTPKTILVNPKGFITCLECSLGQTAVFANGKNGKCGRLDPPKAKGSVRLGLDDLDDPKKVSGGEAGVWSTDYRRPDVCEKPGKNCKKPRADQICKARGLADSTYFDVIAVDRTRWAGGNECVQSKEDQKPVPNKCRTFVTLDCACPSGRTPSGKTCK